MLIQIPDVIYHNYLVYHVDLIVCILDSNSYVYWRLRYISILETEEQLDDSILNLCPNFSGSIIQRQILSRVIFHSPGETLIPIVSIAVSVGDRAKNVINMGNSQTCSQSSLEKHLGLPYVLNGQ